MTDFKLGTRADFQRMVDSEIEETLTLEYKASPALKRESDQIRELCKDVSAMANSAGGQIVYGIEEDKRTHKPVKVDDGIVDEKITREWLLQILNSNIQPRIDQIDIQRIQLSASGYGYVISVEPTVNGPHQAPDKKYYKRFALQVVPMDDYEIRDILGRSTRPDLSISFIFDRQSKTHVLHYASDAEHHSPVGMTPIISNGSNQPAGYAVALVFVDARLTVLTTQYERLSFAELRGQRVATFRLRFLPQQAMPIFKEQPTLMPALGLIVPEDILYQANDYVVGYEVRAPGCTRSDAGTLIVEHGKQLRIIMEDTD